MPIGMTNSNFVIPTKPDPAYATPYEWDGNNYKRLPYLQMVGKGSGALYSCADDMAKFVRFVLNNGDNDSLPDLHSIIEQMEIPESTPAAQLGLKTGYGKGITVDFLNFKYPFFGHDGAGLGFGSRYAYNRDLKVGFVICCSNPSSIVDLLINYMTKSLQEPKSIPVVPTNIETLKTYEGYYQLKSPRFEILNRYLEELFHGYHIALKGDSLHACGFKRPDRVLLPVTSNIFRNPNENLPSFLFATSGDGNKVMYEWGAYYERTSFVKILIIRFFVLGSLICALLLILSSLFWLFKTILKRLRVKEYLERSLSAFGVLSLIIAFGTLAYMAENVWLMGTINFFTITFYIGTLMFALLSLSGFIFAVNNFRHMTNKWTKWYLLTTTTWLLVLVAFYFHYDWIGLRMWSY